MQKNLLVCSVYAGSDNLNAFWLKMQFDWLRKSCGETFDHAVYLNAADAKLFGGSFVVGSSPVFGDASRGHYRGLEALRRYCHSHNYYEYYLFLDSDCFPIRADWLETLSVQMARYGKNFAAVIRAENLDVFPHPCVFFTSDVNCITFGDVPGGTNLLAMQISDVACTAEAKGLFPLIKTNRVTRHPVIGSIYYDLFYHHGCGSRSFVMRSTEVGYYDKAAPEYADFDVLTSELTADPEKYLNTLGWKK